MMDDTEEITLLSLILRKRRRKRRNYRGTRSKPRFWVRDFFTRREEHGEFHWLVQELKLGLCRNKSSPPKTFLGKGDWPISRRLMVSFEVQHLKFNIWAGISAFFDFKPGILIDFNSSIIRQNTCAYQGVRNVRFSEIWRALFSWNTRFEILPFALLPKNWIYDWCNDSLLFPLKLEILIDFNICLAD